MLSVIRLDVVHGQILPGSYDLFFEGLLLACAAARQETGVKNTNAEGTAAIRPNLMVTLLGQNRFRKSNVLCPIDTAYQYPRTFPLRAGHSR